MDQYIKIYSKKAASVNINTLALCEILKKKFILKTQSDVIENGIMEYVTLAIEKRYQTILRSLCVEWGDLVNLNTINEIHRLVLKEVLRRGDDELSDASVDASPRSLHLTHLKSIQEALDSQLPVDMVDFFQQTLDHVLAQRDMNSVVNYLNTFVIVRLHLPVVE